MHIDPSIVPNVPNASDYALHLKTLIRATVRVTGIDPSRLPIRPTADLYTVRAASLWVATHMLPIRPSRCCRPYNISKACVTETLQGANLARQLQANVGRVDYLLLVTSVPKIYAQYCLARLPELPAKCPIDYPKKRPRKKV